MQKMCSTIKMYMTVGIYFCGLAVVSQSDSVPEDCDLPTFVTPCRRNDPNLSECWRLNIEEARPQLLIGIPEFNIPPIEPWKSVAKFATEATTCHIDHSFMGFNGCSIFNVVNNTICLKKNRITLELQFPQLQHTCTAAGNGTLLNYTLSGGGCSAAHANVTISYVLNGERTRKHGKEYIDFNNVTVNSQGKYTNSEVHDFVEGTPEDNEAFSCLMGRNPDLIFPLYNNCMTQTIGIEIANIIVYVYSTYPLDCLHPLK